MHMLAKEKLEILTSIPFLTTRPNFIENIFMRDRTKYYVDLLKEYYQRMISVTSKVKQLHGLYLLSSCILTPLIHIIYTSWSYVYSGLQEGRHHLLGQLIV